MSSTPARIGYAGILISLVMVGSVLAQAGPIWTRTAPGTPQSTRPDGPAARKAEDLLNAYTARIEKEIAEGRKEVDRLRAELHELVDLRYAMSVAIADLKGELATKGVYSSNAPPVNVQPSPRMSPGAPQGAVIHRDLVYGIGSALPKNPTPEQREQLRRLAPRTDLKRMIERLRAEVDETRAEVDELVYNLLELQAGMPATVMGWGGMGGGGQSFEWFGSLGSSGGMR